MGNEAVNPQKNETEDKKLDKLPASLSVALSDGSCEKLIEKGTALPVLVERVFSAPYKNPHALCAAFYAGERLKASENTLVKKIRIVVRKTAGERIRVTLRIGVKHDGEIEIWLFDHGSHHQKRKTVSNAWLPDEETVTVTDKNDEADIEADLKMAERLSLLHKAKAEVFCASHLDGSEKKLLEVQDKDLIKKQTRLVKGLIKKSDPDRMSDGEVNKLKEEVSNLRNLLP